MFRVPTNAPTRIRKPYFSPTDRAVDPCLRPHFSVDDVKIFAHRALSNRHSTENTLRLVSALLAEFVIFAQTHNPITVLWRRLLYRNSKMDRCHPSTWTYCVGVRQIRTESIRRCLAGHFPPDPPRYPNSGQKLFGQTHTSRRTYPRGIPSCVRKPCLDRERPSGFRLYCSLSLLLALESLRFGDAREMAQLPASKSAIVDEKR